MDGKTVALFLIAAILYFDFLASCSNQSAINDTLHEINLTLIRNGSTQ